jgi:uncharacterized protein (DUF433 family)
MTLFRAFTLEQAATVAQVSERRARYWASRGVLVPHLLYDRARAPHRYLYDFTDVVGLRTLGLLRDEYGLSLQQLRKAYDFLRQHADRPWSELRFWVRGNELLFTDPGTHQVVSAMRPGQAAIPIEIEPVAQSVRDAAKALSRRSPGDIGKTEQHRNIQANQLVVKGTRVPVASILELDEDGYPPDAIVRVLPSLTPADVHAILAEYGRRGAA